MHLEYHTLNERQFEELVIELCVELLGDGVQGFVSGKDGGRDARFAGRAKRIPSSDAPWNGTVVIQAKHTEYSEKKFSDSDFSGESESCIIAEEIPKIRRLVQDGELDYYMMFANRRLTGVAEQNIRKKISDECGLDRRAIRLFDSSELDRLVKRFPECVERADLNPVKSPLFVDPEQIAEIITKLAQYKDDIDDLVEGEALPPSARITIPAKNRHNGLREDYFKRHMRPRMVDFCDVRRFLAHPDNQPYVSLYEETASEFQAKLDAWRDASEPYEKLLEALVDGLFKRDSDLRRNKSLTRTVVYYMYCNCDIGGLLDD